MGATDAIDLVRLKIALEFGTEPDGDTLPPAVTNGEAQPRLLVSRYRQGETMLFRADVPRATRERLSQLGVDCSMTDENAVRDVLGGDQPIQKIWRIRWYTTERVPEPGEYRDVVMQDGHHVVIAEGRAVARAWSSCDGPTAAEVEVETDDGYRRRGYARQVVASWIATVLGEGRVGFYSHLTDNTASAALAASLGLAWLSDEIEYL